MLLTLKNAHHEAVKKDKKGLYFIHQGMSDEDFEKIGSATSVEQDWDASMTSLKGANIVKKVSLKTLCH